MNVARIFAPIEPLPHVTGVLSYVVPPAGKPHSYMYDPPPGIPKLSAAYEQHAVVIRNLRPIAQILVPPTERREPVPRVHNDYTEKSGPQRVRDLMADDAQALLRRRFSIINVWRPIREPLEDWPLALCDARSVTPGDLIATDLLYKDRTGETYSVRHNSAHRWFYAPNMRRDEVLLFRCYDSSARGQARFVPHAAFEDPTAPLNATPRESIELRCLVFY